MLHEAPKILVHFALPKRSPLDPNEALLFAIDPASGNLVCQVAVSDERLRTFTYARPASFPIPRDAALGLASAILEHFAPDLGAALERLRSTAALRLVARPGDGPEAA